MKKNLGFTLIELIAVITILGIIALITVPAINNAIEKSKAKALEEQTQRIVDAAKNYAVDNISILPIVDSQQKLIKVTDLVTNGYLKEIPVSPVTQVNMDKCVVVTYSAAKDKYDYLYGECIVTPIVSNTYPLGNIHYIYSAVSDEKKNTVASILGSSIYGNYSLISKYATNYIYTNILDEGYLFNSSNVLIDAFDITEIRVSDASMYKEFYQYLLTVKTSMTTAGITNVYFFANPDTLTFYYGPSYKYTPEFVADLASLTLAVSNKDVSSPKKMCDVLTAYYPGYYCPFDSMDKITMD